MKAIQFQSGKDLADSQVALEVDLPKPIAKGHDILVQVEAISLNPVDTKVRPDADEDPSVLGYDAAGVVVEVGEKVTSLEVGHAVYYAGDITRPGTNSEYHLVDSRIAAVRPKSLSAGASAALPLTSLTAWESLFDRLKIDPGGAQAGKSILIIGGAGGVGSMGIQLAKQAGLTVIATASRPESSEWCQSLGADHTVNHRENLAPQLEQIGHQNVNCIANFNNTAAYWKTMGEVISPQGRIVLIVESSDPLDFGGPYKSKSISVSWEFMFTRSMFTTDDIEKQQEILTEIARLIDSGEIKTTSNTSLTPINAGNVIEAHRMIESGQTIGKISIQGWAD